MRPESYPDAGSTAIVPLFPLGTVLMPGCPLPLRIFEPRYRRLLEDVTAPGASRRFGVAALTTGLEVDTGLDDAVPEVASVGTVAEVLEVHPDDNDTYDIFTGGSQRFRIERVIDGIEPYLQAEVTFLDEPMGDLPPGLAGAARALAAEYTRLIESVRGGQAITAAYRSSMELPDDEILLSYRLASESPLSLHDQQQLLEDATCTARLLHVQRVLRREVVLLRRTRSIAVSPAVLQLALGLN